MPGRHDLSVLFDDDGKIYIISGGGSPYPIEELAPDLRSFVTNAPRRQLVVPPGPRMGEGHHLYKINGKYVRCFRHARRTRQSDGRRQPIRLTARGRSSAWSRASRWA